MKGFLREKTLVAVGVLLILLGWHFTAESLGELIIATPQQAFRGMLAILSDPHNRADLWLSLQRIVQSVLLSSISGFVLGLLAGFYPLVRIVLSPLRWLLLSIPPVILVVLSMLWLGMGSAMIIFITLCLLTPSIYVNTEKAVRMIDPNLLEMSHVYRFSVRQRVWHVYIPAIAAPLNAALLLAMYKGVRLVVLAELLGGENGIGYTLAAARSNFDSQQLYGWVLIVLLIVACFEWLLLQPLQRYLTRWQQEPRHAASR